MAILAGLGLTKKPPNSPDMAPKFTKKVRMGRLLFFELDSWDNWREGGGGGVNKLSLSTYLWPVSWAMCRADCKPVSLFTLPEALLQIEFKLARAEENNTFLSLLLFFEYKAI